MSVDQQKQPDTSWMEQAACRKQDPRKWFPPPTRSGGNGRGYRSTPEVQEALLTCNSCEVKKNCLEYSLPWEPFGIWGGKTEQERNKIRNERNITLLRTRPSYG